MAIKMTQIEWTSGMYARKQGAATTNTIFEVLQVVGKSLEVKAIVLPEEKRIPTKMWVSVHGFFPLWIQKGDIIQNKIRREDYCLTRVERNAQELGYGMFDYSYLCVFKTLNTNTGLTMTFKELVNPNYHHIVG